MKEIFKIAVSLENAMQYQLLKRINLKKNSQNLIMGKKFHLQFQD